MKNSLLEILKKVLFGSKERLRGSSGAGSKGLFYVDMKNLNEKDKATKKNSA